MSTPHTWTDAFATTRRSAAVAFAKGSAILVPPFIAAVDGPRCQAGQAEISLYRLTDRTCHSAFLTTFDGVVLFDAPRSLGHNIQQTVRRAMDYVAAPNGAINNVDHDLGQ